MDPDDLRKRAEARLAPRRGDVPEMSPEQARALFHELQTHQLELEMQNDELRRAQAALLDARDRYSDLYDFAPVGYVTIGEKGLILEANLTAVKMLGVSRAQLIDRRLSAFVLPADQDVFYLNCRCLRERGERREFELRMRKRGSEPFWARMACVAVEAAESEAPSFRVVLSDVTQRKRAEQQLQELNEQLEERIAERTAEAERRTLQVRRLAEQLARTEQLQRRRLAEVLHDQLQQLLVAAKMQVQMLRASAPDEDRKRRLEQVSELLARGLSETRSLTTELSPKLLFDGGLSAAVEWLGQQMGQRYDLTVAVRADPDVCVDPEGAGIVLFQAVRELLFNVVKHAKVRDAAVSIRCVDGDRVRVVVTDEGAGYDPAEGADGVGGNGGFGLANIRDHLELLGGRLDLDSAVGRGTRVTMWAPLDASATFGEPAGGAPGRC